MGLFRRKPKPTEAELRLHRCAFTGHRPERLVGKEGDVIRELRKAIEAAIADGYTTFISGGSRGVDLWAADIVLSLRKENKALKLILAIPFEGFEKSWSADWIKHYKLVRKQADWVQVVAPEYSKEVYQVRNVWMVRRASRLIAVWDGTPSGTQNTISYAQNSGISIVLLKG